MMAGVIERRDYRPQGIFDVRDQFRERQRGDGLAATVAAQVRFAVLAVVTPAGRVEPRDWVLDTRPTLSGLQVYLDRVVEGGRPRVVRTLSPAATSVELRVTCPRFQPEEVAFQPGAGRREQVNLKPAVDYPFEAIATRPDEHGPTLLRGSVLDEPGQGVPDARVEVPEGLYRYRTEQDGAWVIILPDGLPWVPRQLDGVTRDTLDVGIQVTLSPAGTWQTAELLPAAGPATPWSQNGLVMTRTLRAVRGTTVPAPELRLRLT
jgi:hypothetical protein